jgi:hypothetical protein
MYNRMRDQMIDLLTELGKVDISKQPNYLARVALRDALVAYGVPRPTSEMLVSTMKVSVSAQAVNDAELMRRVCETYGVLIGGMYRTIVTDFETNADQVLQAMCADMSLQMEF